MATMAQHDTSVSLLNDVLRGRVTRRGLLARATALGLGTAAIGTLVRLHDTAARAQSGGTPTGSVTWALPSDPANLIPFGGVSTSNMWGKEFMYDSLLAWDRDLNIVPALAESWEAAPDATSYTFKLRQGVTFHNGKTLTAADVKYSFETALNPPEPGIKVAFLENVASIEVVDDLTVTINMSKPDPTLPGVIAWQRYTPIVPEGSGDEINWLSEGIGTGPFRLVEYISNDRVVYTAFEEYWDPASAPCIQELTLKILNDEQATVAALRAGEIDGGTFSADVARTLENNDEIEVLRGLFAAPRVIHFNTVNDVPWRDVRVRQAINKVVDRQEIIDKVYGGEAELTGAIPPGYGDWPLSADELAQLYATDVEAAQALMAEAGYADGFSVTLQAIAAPREYTQIAEVVREQLKQINIDVTVEPLEIGTFAKNIGEGSFEWASTGRGMRGDPSGFVVDFRSGTTLHVAWFGDGWKNDEIDAAYDEALATTDVARRHELYRRIQQIIAEDAVNLYTVQPYKFQAVRRRLSGMYVAYTDFNPGLRTACVTEE
ncbi:MAG TPA: ABC transporter substrate-binding protein [Thermomicrobiales bacterium]